MNFLTALLLTTSVSQAFALVGDSSIFQGSYYSTCESAPKKLQISFEIIGETKTPEATRTEIKKTQFFAGEVTQTVFTHNQAFDGRPFKEKSYLMDHCQKVKGTLEIARVLEKDTLACRISSVDELCWTVNTWVGYSPLGILKWTAQRRNENSLCSEMIEQNAVAFRFADEY